MTKVITLPSSALHLIKQIGERTARLEEHLLGHSTKKDWLTAEEVKNEFDYGKSSLQRFRKLGMVKYKCSMSGRNFRYQRKSLETLLLKSA